MSTDRWGIEDGYRGVDQQWHPVSDSTREALRAAMGAGDEDGPPAGPGVRFVTAGQTVSLDEPRHVALEDGTALGPTRTLAADLPLGYHALLDDDGGEERLVVVPARAHLPAALRLWSVGVQLYGARSRASWGIGDFGDLAFLARQARRWGASLLAVNPLYDASTAPKLEPSPYLPTTRQWLHPIYLRIEDVPGMGSIEDLDALASDGRALNGGTRIDRDAVWRVKAAALRRLWSQGRGVSDDPAFRRWQADQGEALERHATYRALADEHGPNWHRWPEKWRHPDTPAVAAWVEHHRDIVDFWAWLQWLTESQRSRAEAELVLLTDLPVGVDPDGSDAWRWQDVLATTVHVGAPPDTFAPQGQDWAAAPFIPWRLRACAYQPFVELLRAACRPGGALRIDHVMGLFRVFWVPTGLPPTDGGYVRFPGTELIDLVALESVRAGTVIVGEDLGTVEPAVRERMAERSILSTTVVLFTDDPPEDYPWRTMATATTHDLPTVAGAWSGQDERSGAAAGQPVDHAEAATMRRRLAAAAGVGDDAPVDVLNLRLHEALGASPAALVSVALDDLLELTERPNRPGTTTDQHPNWSGALPVAVEDVVDDPAVSAVVHAIDEARRSPPPEPPDGPSPRS